MKGDCSRSWAKLPWPHPSQDSHFLTEVPCSFAKITVKLHEFISQNSVSVPNDLCSSPNNFQQLALVGRQGNFTQFQCFQSVFLHYLFSLDLFFLLTLSVVIFYACSWDGRLGEMLYWLYHHCRKEGCCVWLDGAASAWSSSSHPTYCQCDCKTSILFIMWQRLASVFPVHYYIEN